MSGLHVIQVNINDGSDKTVTGIWEFDRTLGGVLVIPSGSTFPASPIAGEIFWDTSNNELYRRDSSNSYWSAVSGSSVVSGQESYVLVTLTGSLPNGRQLSGANGVNVSDGGPGGKLVISQDATYMSSSHAAIRQLVHFAQGSGPFESFGTLYNTTGPQPFPTASVWYSDVGHTKKIVSQEVVYNVNKTVFSETWKAYDTDGVTVLATSVDTPSYSGVFETNRVRVVTL